ncbi:phosphotransferase enzyme family domain protein [Burkholderia mallei]|nr:phosphotransferase enzyme family domain protein [Burkholderia mallei]KOS74639.1 phosphotransferase enzyme family domain protein [Burkholderia mallei]KOS99167.1 phosphotransferase enzyme family domain protein [Burkholderia mallei]KOT18203.1 phosphotransferase enzyme family domain protein [Burkholderia mallei]
MAGCGPAPAGIDTGRVKKVVGYYMARLYGKTFPLPDFQ